MNKESNTRGTAPYDVGSPQERIVTAGRKLFFEVGFSRISTDALCKEAGVSKATLYKYFPNMSEVLVAVTSMEGDRFEPASVPPIETLEELEAALVDYGTRLLTFLNEPDILHFSLLMHEEARAHPDNARAFYGAAYQRGLDYVQEVLRRAEASRSCTFACAHADLADMLLGMWEGMGMVRANLCVDSTPFRNPGAWAAQSVRTLLQGCICPPA